MCRTCTTLTATIKTDCAHYSFAQSILTFVEAYPK
jgi:hypothetical protein